MRVTCALVCTWLVVAGCGTEQLERTSGSGRTEWIKIGMTTREEIMARYGEPDATAQLPQGEVALYRAPGTATPSPPPSIPVVTPGPLGQTVTEMKPVEPGLGTSPLSASGAKERPSRTIWIRYDTRGVVQEWSFDRLSVMPESAP